MDDLAHESRPIHSLNRKRKADPDEHNVPSSSGDPSPQPEPMLIDVQATPRCPADAVPPGPSSAPWPIAHSRQGMAPSWPQSTPPSCPPSSFLPQRNHEGQPSSKRLRIDTSCTSSGSSQRARRSHKSSRQSGRTRRTGDTRDTGIVSATEPGPSRGSLLRTPSLPTLPLHSRSVPVSPIEPITVSPHIPPHQPPINRDTLKELDLEAILRNPQLRHDLLFDSGLQFRPTTSRRKRDVADHYWLTIVRELECGCTCTTLDANGKIADRICACSGLTVPTDRPLFVLSPGNVMTVRTPSRIRPLLHELLEVLVSIIQPPPPPSTARSLELHFPPPPQHPQFQQNVAHIALLRQLLDPELIQQEIDHGLFDPSGVFQAIGDIIRCHCAPMRDAAVDQMVALAKGCAPGGGGTKLDAVRAIRMCFEIMELMKLDVANHQLQTLRPYLVRTAAQYEIRTFQERQKEDQPAMLDITRMWLLTAYEELAESTSLHSQRFLRQSRQSRITMAIVKAVVGLIFDPPAGPPRSLLSSATTSVATTPASSTVSTPVVSSPPLAPSSSSSSSSRLHGSNSSSSFAGYPETLYLDYGRLATLSTDAADFTALYMLLMLYRQLVHSHLHNRSNSKSAAELKSDTLRLKKEIWEIGQSHLGLCFMRHRPRSGFSSSSGSSSRSSSGRSSSSRHEKAEREREDEMKKWRSDMADIVLQVTRRAVEPRNFSPGSSSVETLSAPDESVLKLANSWAETNFRMGSPLSTLMKKRIRDCVEEQVMNIVLPSLSTSSPSSSSPSSTSLSPTSSSSSPKQQQSDTTSGLEPLMPEIRHLAERTAKLVNIHANVYGVLYSHPAFLGIDLPEAGTWSTTDDLITIEIHAPLE